MPKDVENKAVDRGRIDKKGGYPAGRPVSAHQARPVRFPTSPAPKRQAEKTR